ncbi:MAG: leucine--tRNA ligase [Chlamydiae bacterium CG10_big_fil_rev_8_21_14_0_10_35_9]|nr:MAG: leucine--tRNA ligase [Chlamydiae bacterium CG10_big_fil_rev_8_21_14_0_10_35_9]
MTKRKYDHRSIEKKWQQYWVKNKVFSCKTDSSKPKYYVLDMFPYPSGAGLHVGHVTGYTGTDIIARYKRQKGFNVLHPIGWDSFGLPAEQYAIRTGTHPRITTQANIDTYRKQLRSLGFSYDWDREITTSEPDYYKWTQWIFTKLYEKGLAYEATINVNFCPALGTVLANEEVENGKSKEGGFPIERRPLRQWVLKITAYADRLLEDLKELDWPDHLKKLQTNWIGKSVGAQISFEEEVTKEKIEVFTTRPDTLMGASYVVLAPEHPLVDTITTQDKLEDVRNYRQTVAQKSDLERTELNKDKTGVWTGGFAVHPVTHEKIPIWISDYVLMSYGTGAVMAVPAHDERDFAFASKYKLPILPVYEPNVSLLSEEERKDAPPETIKKEVASGKRCWTLDGTVIHSSHKDLSLNGLSMKEAKVKMTKWLENHGAGKKTINYKLRDWLFSRQRYWGEPIPILHFEDGSKRALELDELPLTPPSIEDYMPSPTGESPIAKEKKWIEIIDPKTKKKAVRETNTMPQWAGSCWYYLRFCDPNNKEEAWSKESEDYWMPVDLYVGGAEHAVLHLLYARFWHKVLYDCSLVHTKEPFKTYRNQGLVHAKSYKIEGGNYVAEDDVMEENGAFFKKDSHEKLLVQEEKMSKSKLNGVTPDEIIEEYGADSLRLYEMFMGPFDREKLWNTDAVNGCKRFLNRFWDLFFSDKVVEEETEEGLRLAHRLVHTVTADIEAMQFNTAIARLMEFINDFTKLKAYPKKALKMALQMLYPFAPHISEELWEVLEIKEPLAFAPIEKVQEKYLKDTHANYVVQVNGKLRAKMQFETGKTENEIMQAALQDPNVAKYLTGKIVKTIFVPNKLLSIVVK